MKPNTTNNTPYYNRSGIYKLTCNTYKLAYVGQTSRSLKLRFQEHILNSNLLCRFIILSDNCQFPPSDGSLVILL
jgi:hypothetical protein